MLPDKIEAENLLNAAEKLNPGPWADHSRIVANCAKKIAENCSYINPEKAYIVGLLHDIGRRFGVTYLAHVIDGYHYLLNLGYDEAARICLTHSFAEKDINTYIGNADVPQETYTEIEQLIEEFEYDDYDRLIQLCDSISFPDGVVDLTTRMDDVERRYGSYPKCKREKNFEIKHYFEEKMNRNLYEVVTENKELWGA